MPKPKLRVHARLIDSCGPVRVYEANSQRFNETDYQVTLNLKHLSAGCTCHRGRFPPSMRVTDTIGLCAHVKAAIADCEARGEIELITRPMIKTPYVFVEMERAA